MPQIIIETDGPGDHETTVHRERIDSAAVAPGTADGRLAERIGWALQDAEGLESQAGDTAASFSRRRGTIADTAVHVTG